MGDFIQSDLLEWYPVRPDVATGVFGKTLLDNGTKVMLVRVAAGGGFACHRDGYGHLFYFLAGEGVVRVEEKESPVRPGLIVRVVPGDAHSYENLGTEDLLLISVNVPQ